jgi:hypothetical protein
MINNSLPLRRSSGKSRMDSVDLSTMTFYFKLGEYPDLDSATVRSAKFDNGTPLSKIEKANFKTMYPTVFYELLWKFIGQFGV